MHVILCYNMQIPIIQELPVGEIMEEHSFSHGEEIHFNVSLTEYREGNWFQSLQYELFGSGKAFAVDICNCIA